MKMISLLQMQNIKNGIFWDRKEIDGVRIVKNETKSFNLST